MIHPFPRENATEAVEDEEKKGVKRDFGRDSVCVQLSVASTLYLSLSLSLRLLVAGPVSNFGNWLSLVCVTGDTGYGIRETASNIVV